MPLEDPLGLTRCASCTNAFERDRLPDGTCKHCGGWFDGAAPPITDVRYCLLIDGDDHPVATLPRDPEGFGAMQAVNYAQALSIANGACDVFIGDRPLCRYERGRRVPNHRERI